MALAKRQDKRAVPVLQRLLGDDITFEEHLWAEEHEREAQAEELFRLLNCLYEAVKAVEQFNDPSLVPALRKAIRQYWAVEQAFGDIIHWSYYYWSLAHALGHFGDFAALQDLNLPPAIRKLTMVYMALGALNHPTGPGHDTPWDLKNSNLQRQGATLLAEHFGLSTTEQQDCIENFPDYGQARRRREQDGTAGIIIENATHEEEEDEEDPDEIELVPWIAPTFTCVYEGHHGPVHSLAWAPNSTCLASASGDGTVQIWNPTTGQMLLTFRRHIESVNAVSWSPQGTYLASGGNDSLVYVWEATTGTPVTVYEGHRAWINKGLAWSPDRTRVASASRFSLSSGHVGCNMHMKR